MAIYTIGEVLAERGNLFNYPGDLKREACLASRLVSLAEGASEDPDINRALGRVEVYLDTGIKMGRLPPATVARLREIYGDTADRWEREKMKDALQRSPAEAYEILTSAYDFAKRRRSSNVEAIGGLLNAHTWHIERLIEETVVI